MISDDPPLCRLISEYMGNDNIEVHCVSSAAEALDDILDHESHLVTVDFQLPGIDGFEMLHMIQETIHAPILAITPCLSSNEKVALFHAGANAYIEKPVDISVCAAQLATLMKLHSDSSENPKDYAPLVFGTELIISPRYRLVIIDGKPLELTRTEFDLIFCLAKHPGQVWSRAQLYRSVWDDTLGMEGEHTVRTHIGNLRKKLADVGKEYVQTAWGVGYKFIPPDIK